MSTDRLIAELIGTYGMFTVVPFSVQDPAEVLARDPSAIAPEVPPVTATEAV
jgi:hypothetical protein